MTRMSWVPEDQLCFPETVENVQYLREGRRQLVSATVKGYKQLLIKVVMPLSLCSLIMAPSQVLSGHAKEAEHNPHRWTVVLRSLSMAHQRQLLHLIPTWEESRCGGIISTLYDAVDGVWSFFSHVCKWSEAYLVMLIPVALKHPHMSKHSSACVCRRRKQNVECCIRISAGNSLWGSIKCLKTIMIMADATWKSGIEWN